MYFGSVVMNRTIVAIGIVVFAISSCLGATAGIILILRGIVSKKVAK